MCFLFISKGYMYYSLFIGLWLKDEKCQELKVERIQLSRIFFSKYFLKVSRCTQQHTEGSCKDFIYLNSVILI